MHAGTLATRVLRGQNRGGDRGGADDVSSGSMSRFLLAAALVTACAVAPVFSCTANLTQNCIAGPCTLGGGGAGGSGGATAGSGVTSSTHAGTGGAGTGGSAPNAASCPQVAQAGDFPCDVFAVVHAQCNPCHQMPTQNGAPFPLLTYADTQAPYSPSVGLVFQQMFISISPSGSPRMPLGGPYLDPADYATLHDWLGECAPPVPAGTGCGCPGTGCDGGQ